MRLRKKHWAVPEMKENPFVYFQGEENRGKWKEVFGNDFPIYLEIGAGKGKFSTEMALRHPNCNYIMLELESNAFVYGTRKILEKQLHNVRALPAHAENILDYFEEDEIDGIYINFCNPWPKKRHNKRRLTYPDFLKKYARIMKKGSKLELRTDDRPFFEDSLEYFKECKWAVDKISFHTSVEDFNDDIITEYEEKWRSKNIPICYGIFHF